MYCYTCGSKLKETEIELGFFDTQTGKPVTYLFKVCLVARSEGFWKRLFHRISEPGEFINGI